MIMMLCSECGAGYTRAEFQTVKIHGCNTCGNTWFYSNNMRNRETMRSRLEKAGRPLPDHLKINGS